MQLASGILGYARNYAYGSLAQPDETDAAIYDDSSEQSIIREQLALIRQSHERCQLQVLGPTLLPENLASLVTAASLAARVSLRASALFLEALLEGARYSSLTGLGITRRMLVSAVSSVKALHYLHDRMGWAGDLTNENAFLSVLERYSSLGVYVIHSTFSLAELFTMSGFSLTADILSTGIGAAEETVKAFDGIFGSNESSRALASIISMVRREVMQDPSFPIAQKGLVGGLAALTKALTAFACLQIATHRRTQESQRLHVLYDCTVVTGSEAISTQFETIRDTLWDAEAFEEPKVQGDPSRRQSLAAVSTPAVHALVTPRKSSASSHKKHYRNESDEFDIGSVRGSRFGTTEVDAGTPFGSARYSRASLRSLTAFSDAEEEEVAHGLGEMLGESIVAQAKDLPDDVRLAIDGIIKGERALRPAVDLLEQYSDSEGSRVELVRSRTTDQIFEIETITTTDIKTIVRVSGPGPQTRRMTAQRLTPGTKSSRSSRDLVSLHAHSQARSADGHAISVEDTYEQEEWVEVSETTSGIERAHKSPEVGRISRDDAFEHPGEGRQKLNMVLKTMTQRLVQRKRLVRRPDGEGTETYRADRQRGSPDMRQIDWQPSPSSSPQLIGSKWQKPVKRILEVAKKRSHARLRPSKINSASASASSASSEIDMPSPPMPSQDRDASAAWKKGGRRSSAGSLRSVRTSRTNVETKVEAHEPAEVRNFAFPKGHLVSNLRRFVRYSSAAYGQAFLRILGIGNLSFNFSSSADHHANVHAFCHHTGLPLDAVLLSSFTEPSAFMSTMTPPLVHYVAVDHEASAIVLTCRGTLGLSDLLVDLTAEYDECQLPFAPDDKSFYAHSGMLSSAKALCQESSRVHEELKRALTRYPKYGLVLCGHSLGGGVVALLSILLSCPSRHAAVQTTPALSSLADDVAFVTSVSSGLPAGRPIHCFVFGPPCVASADLSFYAKGLITCIVNNTDIVPSLSLGMFKDLKTIAATLWEEPQLAEEAIGRVIGLYQARRKERHIETSTTLKPIALTPSERTAGRTTNRALEPGYQDPALLCAADNDDLEVDMDAQAGPEYRELDLWATMKTIRAGSDADKLYPPGEVYIVSLETVYVAEREEMEDYTRAPRLKQAHDTRQEARRVIFRQVEDVTLRFGEPTFSRTMLTDHSPRNCQYELAMETLAAAVLPK